MKILVVDDEQEIVDLLNIYLANEGYEVVKAYDGQEALDILAQQNDISLVLLDLMMPNVDGHQVLAEINEHYPSLPVIIISAKTTLTDRISGLTSGADDYIMKPFEPLEVIARVKTLLRRQNQNIVEEEVDTSILEIGPLIIDQDSHDVRTVDGKSIQLTAIEFGILYLLASNPNVVYSAEEIFEAVWNQEIIVSAKTVMVHVSHLRDKIVKATGGEKVIETVWGVGYKING